MWYNSSMGRVYKFNAIPSNAIDVPFLESFPVFDEYNEVVGAFLLKDEGILSGFLAGNGYPLALTVSIGESFHFTPMEGKTGQIEFAIISQKPFSVNSIKITAEES